MPRAVDHVERRRALVSATLRLVREAGTGAVTIRGVAEAMGGSTTAVTHYVRDRRELLHAAVGWALQDRRRVLTDAAAGPDPLRSVLLRSVDAADAAVWRALLVAAADREPELAPLLRDFDAWWDRVVGDLVVATGTPDPSTVTDALGALVDGLVLTGDTDGWDDDRRAATVERCLAALVRPSR